MGGKRQLRDRTPKCLRHIQFQSRVYRDHREMSVGLRRDLKKAGGAGSASRLVPFHAGRPYCSVSVIGGSEHADEDSKLRRAAQPDNRSGRPHYPTSVIGWVWWEDESTYRLRELQIANLKSQTENRKSKFENRNSKTENRRSKIQNPKSCIPNHRPRAANRQSQIANCQSPIGNHQSPITNHQLPITNRQSPIANHRLPSDYAIWGELSNLKDRERRKTANCRGHSYLLSGGIPSWAYTTSGRWGVHRISPGLLSSPARSRYCPARHSIPRTPRRSRLRTSRGPPWRMGCAW